MIYKGVSKGICRTYYLGMKPSARYDHSKGGVSYLYEHGDFEFIDKLNRIFVLSRDSYNLLRNLNNEASVNGGILNSFPSGHWIWFDEEKETYHIMFHKEEIQESKDNIIHSIDTLSFSASGGEITAYSNSNLTDAIFKITIQGCEYDIQEY